jgi:hypothetical protein
MKKLVNEKFDNPYTSPNTIGVIKSRTMKFAEHVQYTVDMRISLKILAEDLMGKAWV